MRIAINHNRTMFNSHTLYGVNVLKKHVQFMAIVCHIKKEKKKRESLRQRKSIKRRHRKKQGRRGASKATKTHSIDGYIGTGMTSDFATRLRLPCIHTQNCVWLLHPKCPFLRCKRARMNGTFTIRK